MITAAMKLAGRADEAGGPGDEAGGPGDEAGGPGDEAGGPGDEAVEPGGEADGPDNEAGGPDNEAGEDNEAGGPDNEADNEAGEPDNEAGEPDNEAGEPDNEAGGPKDVTIWDSMVGKDLRVMRESRGLSRKGLIKLLSGHRITEVQLRKYELGYNRPTIGRIYQIITALRISWQEYIDRLRELVIYAEEERNRAEADQGVVRDVAQPAYRAGAPQPDVVTLRESDLMHSLYCRIIRKEDRKLLQQMAERFEKVDLHPANRR